MNIDHLKSTFLFYKNNLSGWYYVQNFHSINVLWDDYQGISCIWLVNKLKLFPRCKYFKVIGIII